MFYCADSNIRHGRHKNITLFHSEIIFEQKDNDKEYLSIEFEAPHEAYLFFERYIFEVKQFGEQKYINVAYNHEASSIQFDAKNIPARKHLEVNILANTNLKENAFDLHKRKCWNNQPVILCELTGDAEITKTNDIVQKNKKIIYYHNDCIGSRTSIEKMIPVNYTGSPLLLLFVSQFHQQKIPFNNWFENQSISNLHLAKPSRYEDIQSLIHFGGVYRIKNVKLVNQASSYYDFSIVPVPNFDKSGLNDSEENYFSRQSYLVHMTRLFLLQFKLALAGNNKTIIFNMDYGKTFNHDHADIAAIVTEINKLPQFSGIQLIYVRENYSNNYFFKAQNDDDGIEAIYRNPPKDIKSLIKDQIDSINKETNNFEITSLSQQLVDGYKRGCAIHDSGILLAINNHIDNILIQRLKTGMNTTINSLKFMSSEDDKEKQEKIISDKIAYFQHLKSCIKEGLYCGDKFVNIMADWKNSILPGMNKTAWEMMLTDRDGIKQSSTRSTTLISEFANKYDDYNKIIFIQEKTNRNKY